MSTAYTSKDDSKAGDWYWDVGGTVRGPVSFDDLARQAAAGRLGPDDLVRRGADGPWAAARTVPGLVDAPPPPPELRRGPAGIAVSATATDWGWPALVVGCTLLIVLSQLYNAQVAHDGPMSFLRMFAGFVLGLLLLLAVAGSVALGAFGLMTALRTRHALPLCMAGLGTSVVDLVLWLLCAAGFLRSLG